MRFCRLFGFNSDMTHYPDIDATVVVLQNCLPFAPGMAAFQLSSHIQEIFFWELMKPQESVKVDKTVSSDKYDDYAGKYDYGGAIMKIRRDGDHLFAQLADQPEVEIFPKSENEFFWKVVDAQVTFVRDENGVVTHALHHLCVDASHIGLSPECARDIHNVHGHHPCCSEGLPV